MEQDFLLDWTAVSNIFPTMMGLIQISRLSDKHNEPVEDAHDARDKSRTLCVLWGLDNHRKKGPWYSGVFVSWSLTRQAAREQLRRFSCLGSGPRAGAWGIRFAKNGRLVDVHWVWCCQPAGICVSFRNKSVSEAKEIK